MSSSPAWSSFAVFAFEVVAHGVAGGPDVRIVEFFLRQGSRWKFEFLWQRRPGFEFGIFDEPGIEVDRVSESGVSDGGAESGRSSGVGLEFDGRFEDGRVYSSG
jgi:hypothetical protein